MRLREIREAIQNESSGELYEAIKDQISEHYRGVLEGAAKSNDLLWFMRGTGILQAKPKWMPLFVYKFFIKHCIKFETGWNKSEGHKVEFKRRKPLTEKEGE